MAKGKENIARVQVTGKGQHFITLPRALASALELNKGDEVLLVHHPEGLILKKLKIKTKEVNEK